MTIINAFWDTRNLGVETVEVKVDTSDPINDISNSISKLKAKYQVIRAPVNRLDIYSLLHSLNFTFIEAMYHIYFDFERFEIKWGDYDKYVSYRECIDKDDIEFIYATIRKGMYKNDRISLDPYFNKETAAERYVNMIKDKLELGAKVCSIVHQDNDIGFFGVCEKDEKVYDYFLTGIYPSYQGMGFGSNAYTQALAYMKSKGGKLAYGSVSANNPGSFLVNTRSGFMLDFIEYIFIRHI